MRNAEIPAKSRHYALGARSHRVTQCHTIGHSDCDSMVGKRNKPQKVVAPIDRALRYVRLGWVRTAQRPQSHRACCADCMLPIAM